MSIKTNIELAAAMKNVAKHKTLYVMGCFGAPMNEKNKSRWINSYAYNRREDRKPKIQAASADTFGFDCGCLIKGVLWGWNGDTSHVYGGATYNSNGVPDKDADQMIKLCSDVSTDFSNIEIGEMVWMSGHCGVYIGDGLAVEATPIWADGVQITACNCNKNGYNRRDWTKHGKLPWVTYIKEEKPGELYKVTIEGLTKAQADNLAQTYANTDVSVRVEAIEPVKPAPEPVPEPTPVEPETPWIPKEGDIVMFKGGTQYSNSNAASGSTAAAGQAKIHRYVKGAKHPYSLIRTGKTGVYGWVDEGTFTKA